MAKNTAQMKFGNIVFTGNIKGREDQERTNKKEDQCKKKVGGEEGEKEAQSFFKKLQITVKHLYEGSCAEFLSLCCATVYEGVDGLACTV